MSKRIQKQSGLAGITELLRPTALNPNIDLQKAEEKVLNVNNDNFSDNESIKSLSEDEDESEICNLAKELGVNVDGIGPDRVSRNGNSRISHGLDDLSRETESRRPPRIPPSRTKTIGRSSIRSNDRPPLVPQPLIVPRPRTNYSQSEHSFHRQEPVNQYAESKYKGEMLPLRQHKMPVTEEMTKRGHIDGVMSSIRHETHNTFSTEMERTQDMKASKLEQIASIRLALTEEGIDVSKIQFHDMNSPIEEVDSTLQLLLLKNNRYRYSSMAEEIISAGAEVLETVFDGTRTVPIFNIKPDYKGYSASVNVKLHRLRFETSQVVGDVIEKHNISPVARIGMELLPGFFLYPRIRSKTKKACRQDPEPLTDINSQKSFNNIRAKLETDTNKDWENKMQDI